MSQLISSLARWLPSCLLAPYSSQMPGPGLCLSCSAFGVVDSRSVCPSCCSRSAPLTFLLTLSSPRPLLLPRSRPSSPASSSSRTLPLPPSPLTVTLASSGSSRAQHGPHHPLPTTSPRFPCDPSSDHHVPQRSPRSARTRGRLAIQLRPLTPPLWLLPAAHVRASWGPDRLGSCLDGAREAVVSVGDSLRGGRLGEF